MSYANSCEQVWVTGSLFFFFFFFLSSFLFSTRTYGKYRSDKCRINSALLSGVWHSIHAICWSRDCEDLCPRIFFPFLSFSSVFVRYCTEISIGNRQWRANYLKSKKLHRWWLGGNWRLCCIECSAIFA